uniref:Uncharacterized protein n=1 Tax=Opuntia streptacantha TaxID=393608 RepID=A0A7C9DM61_OPUST
MCTFTNPPPTPTTGKSKWKGGKKTGGGGRFLSIIISIILKLTQDLLQFHINNLKLQHTLLSVKGTNLMFSSQSLFPDKIAHSALTNFFVGFRLILRRQRT